MKLLYAVVLFASLGAAAPSFLSDLLPFGIGDGSSSSSSSSSGSASDTANDLEDGSSSDCPEAILVFARGSTETGNMGTTVGPELASALASLVGSLWVQGVGGPYTAGLLENVLPEGTTSDAIAEGARLLELARSKCPNAAIAASGYSQGAALMAAAIGEIKAATSNQIKGAVLFGYTRNAQNGGKIPGFPTDRTLIICHKADLVCDGTLIVDQEHLDYDSDAENQAPEFLAQKIEG